MREQNAKKDKISMKRLLSNIKYILDFSFKENKKMALAQIVGVSIWQCADTVVDTYILLMIVNILTTTRDIKSILAILGLELLVEIVMFFGFLPLSNYFETKIIGFSGNVQRKLMAKARMMDLKYYDIPEYYDDFVIAASQSEEMCRKAIDSVSNIVANVLSMIISGSMILVVNPIVIIFPVLGFIVNIITRFKIQKLEYEYNLEKQRIGRKADYSKRVFYQPEYAKEIKLTGIENALLEQYDEAIAEERKMAMKYALRIIPPTLVNWIFTFTFCQYFGVNIMLGFLAIVKKTIGLAEFTSLKIAANKIQNRLDGMNYAFVDLQNVGQYCEKFRRFMEYEINIEGCCGEVKMPDDCTLELKNVSFKYKDDEDFVIKNVSFKVKKGEKIALVGENGAGKTTLIKLVMRLYDVTEGEITFGGVDIRKLDIREYREKIGAVFQDFQMYGATLGENVCGGQMSEDMRQKVVKALEKADFGEKLKELKDGIDTEMTREFSDDGSMLSGGETQKMAVARIFVKDTDVAILDEPSSALDPIAEYRLNKSMLENAENRAVILISHRLSTTRDADRIILLEKGEIVDVGTHEKLLNKGGEYAQMWNTQAEKYCAPLYA